MEERVQPKADGSLGGFYRPDAETTAALARGQDKLKKAQAKGFVLGADKPWARGNMAEALAEARESDAKRRTTKGRKRRRQMATLRSKKRTSVKKTAPSKKKTVREEVSGDGKIALKTICGQLGLDPKATRVRLRRMVQKGDIDFHDPNGRWEFTKAQAKQIKAHLSA